MPEPLRIVADPEVPRLGDEVKLSVQEANGTPVAGDRPVKWAFIRRDDSEKSLLQSGPVVTIPEWSPQNHGTYYAKATDTGQLATRTFPPAIRVALSGGGYRATLFSLGALMYLVDIEAQHRIEEVASVSGGSIANAIVLDRCDLSTTTRDQFWEIVRDVASRVTRSHLLPATRIPEVGRVAVLLLLAVASLVAVTAVLALWIPSWAAIVAGISFAVAALMLRGFMVEVMLRIRFRLASHLGDKPRPRVSHVFCATDLVVGEPFYFLSLVRGGFVYSGARGAAVKQYPVRKAVRASAAFPFAFLPKHVPLWKERFRWSEQIGVRQAPYKGKHAFCADGGVANNFGTQWFEEQEPVNAPYSLTCDLASDPWHPARETIDIVVDASVPIKASGSGWFVAPFIAEMRSLSRVMRVLYENTLRPRRAAATWGESYLAQQGYAAVVAEHGAAARRRATHRRILISLDSGLLQLPQLLAGEGLEFLPEEVQHRGMDLWSRIRALGAVESEGTDVAPLTRAVRIPTTLFKRSREETADAVLSGYLATFFNCHRFEGLGVPSELDDTVERIRSLGAGGL